MSLKKEGKLQFLKDVQDSKAILFGAFSDTLTKSDKVKQWKAIHEKALALGIVPANKDYTYTRDTYWQNIKKYTVKKIDNRKQTGSGGGPECKLTEIDNIIIDILGRDTPLVKGLSSKETWQNTPALPEKDLEDVEKIEVGIREQTSATLVKTITPQRKKSLLTPLQTGLDEESRLREKKLKLSIEIMEKESYLKSLEILKLERELGLPPSQFTNMFPVAQQVIVLEANTEDESEMLNCMEENFS